MNPRPCWLLEVRHASESPDPILDFIGQGIDQAAKANDEEAMFSWLDAADDLWQTRELAARTAPLN